MAPPDPKACAAAARKIAACKPQIDAALKQLAASKQKLLASLKKAGVRP